MKKHIEQQVRQEQEVERMKGEQALAKKGADLDMREMKMNMQETLNAEKQKIVDQSRQMEDEHKGKMGELAQQENELNVKETAGKEENYNRRCNCLSNRRRNPTNCCNCLPKS
jgi:hypothetical protein